MSKHERQHSVSNTVSTTMSNDNPIPEAKRARIENSNSSPDTNWSTRLYVNTQIKDQQQQTRFSSCFLTDKLLMPDNKKSQQEKSE